MMLLTVHRLQSTVKFSQTRQPRVFVHWSQSGDALLVSSDKKISIFKSQKKTAQLTDYYLIA